MGLNEDLRNCKIIIQDAETGRTIADTLILAYDSATSEIEIDASHIAIPAGTVVSALIFTSNGLYESHGTVGSGEGGKTHITLYEGTGKNDRRAVRYQVNVPGDVESVTRPGQGKLPGGFPITLLNMSSIGLLVQAPEGRIQVGDILRFFVNSKGQRLAITAEAARVEEVSGGKEKVGCNIRLVNLG